MDRSSTSQEWSRRESAGIRRLRRVSMWSVLAGVVVFAIMFGLAPGVVAAAVFAAVYKAIGAAFGQRIKERFERQPDLRLVVSHDGGPVDTVESKTLSPLQLDVDRVIAYEVSCLQEKAAATEKMVRNSPMMLFRTVDQFARQPSDRDYQQARGRFSEKLNEYEGKLRTWLEEYRDAAYRRAFTFELSLGVVSGKSGAYAEDVVLTIDFPEGVEIVDEWPTVAPPPEPPAYILPPPRSAVEIARSSYPKLDPGTLMSLISHDVLPNVSSWQTQSDGLGVLRQLGNIHHDSTVQLDGPLLLQAVSDGPHTLAWTLRTKNGLRHRDGTIDLVFPTTEQHPPLTRLHGIESFPDVPFVDEDGQVVREARTSDPPTEPPARSRTDDLLGQLRDAAAWNEWHALGIGVDADDREDDVGSGLTTDDAAR